MDDAVCRAKLEHDGNVLNLVVTSASAEFYDRLYGAGGAPPPPAGWAAVKRDAASKSVAPAWPELLKDVLPPDALVLELGGGRFQARNGFLNQHFPNYVPLDISASSIRKYSEEYGRFGIVCDATRLPFQDASVDCVCSRTFLEHPRDPDAVLREVARIVKPGGIVVHDDAWFCRWWSRYGVVGLKPFAEMTWSERIIASVAAVTEIPLLRIPPILARRIIRAIFVLPSPKAPLPYGRLTPNYQLLLGCDEDASSSIDPLDVIRFYEARGFQLLKPLGWLKRLFHRNTAVVLKRIA